MSLITDSILDRLAQLNLGQEEFQKVCHRLLSNQVIYSEQSKAEREAYNLFCRMEGEIVEYLEVLGFHVYHDRERNYIALFAPGARTPALEISHDERSVAGLRRTLEPDSVRLLLTCRHLYEQGLKEGRNVDENACVGVSVQVLNQTFQSLFRDVLPVGVARDRIFREIISLRVIDGKQEEWSDIDAWLKIRPVITSMVFNEMINVIAEQLPGDTIADNEDLGDTGPLLEADAEG